MKLQLYSEKVKYTEIIVISSISVKLSKIGICIFGLNPVGCPMLYYHPTMYTNQMTVQTRQQITVHCCTQLDYTLTLDWTLKTWQQCPLVLVSRSLVMQAKCERSSASWHAQWMLRISCSHTNACRQGGTTYGVINLVQHIQLSSYFEVTKEIKQTYACHDILVSHHERIVAQHLALPELLRQNDKNDISTKEAGHNRNYETIYMHNQSALQVYIARRENYILTMRKGKDS